MDAIRFGSIVCHTKSKKNDGDGNQFVDDEPFIDEKKPSSMTVAMGVLNNGEHMLIPVTAKMIHSVVWDSERFVLKDGQPLYMVKLVDAFRNVCVYTKYVQINVEVGMGLVQIILWRKEKECTAQRRMIHDCISHHYICVIGEVKDYYGVHKIFAFNIDQLVLAMKSHIIFWRIISFEKRLEYLKDEMLRAVFVSPSEILSGGK
jgi:hypothetical protein